MRRLAHRDRRDRVTILGTKAAQHVEDLGPSIDRLAEIAERIGELLQLGGVVGDAEVTLEQTPVLGLQVHGTVKLMIAELVDDGSPDLEGGSAGNADDAHDVTGHGVEEPVHEALVHHPLWISALSSSGRGLNVGKKAEFADDGVEEATPLLVVGLDDVQDHRDMGLDVHHHEGGGGRGLRMWRWGIVYRRSEGCGGVSGRAMGRLLEIEQRIDVHGEQRKRKMSTG